MSERVYAMHTVIDHSTQNEKNETKDRKPCTLFALYPVPQLLVDKT